VTVLISFFVFIGLVTEGYLCRDRSLCRGQETFVHVCVESQHDTANATVSNHTVNCFRRMAVATLGVSCLCI